MNDSGYVVVSVHAVPHAETYQLAGISDGHPVILTTNPSLQEVPEWWKDLAIPAAEASVSTVVEGVAVVVFCWDPTFDSVSLLDDAGVQSDLLLAAPFERGYTPDVSHNDPLEITDHQSNEADQQAGVSVWYMAVHGDES